MGDPDPGWAHAQSFAELCRLGARFVLGEIQSFPGWGAPDLDEESDALVPALARANRGGLLTTASQPGRPFGPGHDGRAWAQRAFVAGFAEDATAGKLAAAAARAGLWCAAHPGSDALAAPVGLADGVPYLFAGHDARAAELALFEGEVGSGALAALATACFVWLVDPVWGRRDALPAALADAFAGVAGGL